MTTETKKPVPAVAEPAVGPVCATCAHWGCAEYQRTGTIYDPSGNRAFDTIGKLRVDGHVRDGEGRDGGAVAGVCHLEPALIGAQSDHYCSRHSDKTDFEAYWLREIHNMLFSKL